MSPVANKHLGPYGCYSLGIVLYILVLLYLIFRVKPVRRHPTNPLHHNVSMVVTDFSLHDEQSTVCNKEDGCNIVEGGCEKENDRYKPTSIQFDIFSINN